MWQRKEVTRSYSTCDAICPRKPIGRLDDGTAIRRPTGVILPRDLVWPFWLAGGNCLLGTTSATAASKHLR